MIQVDCNASMIGSRTDLQNTVGELRSSDRHSQMNRRCKDDPQIVVGVVTQDFDASGSKRSNAFGHSLSLSLAILQINSALMAKLVVDTLTASEFDPSA